MKASSHGHLPVAEALIQAKADVNAHDVSSCSIPVFVNLTSALAKCTEAVVLSLTSSASLCLSASDEFSNEGSLMPNKCKYLVCLAFPPVVSLNSVISMCNPVETWYNPTLIVLLT